MGRATQRRSRFRPEDRLKLRRIKHHPGTARHCDRPGPVQAYQGAGDTDAAGADHGGDLLVGQAQGDARALRLAEAVLAAPLSATRRSMLTECAAQQLGAPGRGGRER